MRVKARVTREKREMMWKRIFAVTILAGRKELEILDECRMEM